MTITLPQNEAAPHARSTGPVPVLDVVIPVHNEEAVLEASARRLHRYLSGNFPYPFRITVADNASTDATWRIAQRLSRELTAVNALHLDEKGRGRALRTAWAYSEALVLAYMDVDLSTDLAAARFSDAQCGFKAVRADVAERLLPLVEDTGWFFDTELLVLAQRTGLRIHEVPVDWVDDPHSSVAIVATAFADLKGIARLFRTGRAA